jgi:bifunctional non-homologous end joining protein LigD
MTKQSDKQAGSDEAEVAGVRLTHPDRPLWPGQGATKRDLALHLKRAAPRLLPHVAGRPLTLLRCPRGGGARCFVQRNAGPGFGRAVRRVELVVAEKTATVPVVEDVAGLVSLVQVGVLEIHPWGATADDPARADRLVFDLDPGEGVGWAEIAAAAREVAARVEAAGLVPFLKTSGGKGLHVVAPLAPRQPWDRAAEAAGEVASALAADAPDRFTTALPKEERAGRIFVDVLRNRRGASAVAPWSPRAREGAPVSAPIAWAELDALPGPAAVTLSNAAARLAAPDPWAGFEEARRPLARRP